MSTIWLDRFHKTVNSAFLLKDRRGSVLRAFIDWLTGPQGQAAIGAFTINGEGLFTPSAE